MDLAGRVAVITGAATGIGAATARLMASRGATVVGVDRNAAALDALCAGLPGSMALVGDVGDEATVAAHARSVEDRFGAAAMLVTAAGWSTGKGVVDSTLDDWSAVLKTNLTGTFLWCRALLPGMIARKTGSIVLVGSQLAFAGGRSNAPYLASKGAVASLARCMALDHADDGIRVNVVVPGAIDTPLLNRAFARSADPQAARARSVARHPLGRLGRAEEVARAILFLAGDDASFTTGSCLMVDGGWLAA
ncbi:MAG: SDR family oxidoreductase [Burkholderiales bacterium]|jgi:2-keto-3-deoxy-L-fuconate dehydrogenase|nr:SDR family oxidoreductase [Burkholderiales bacterium]